MGTKIKDLIKTKEEISLDELSGKILAVDSFNVLYKYLTTIRQRDGSPLMDSKSQITSHLSGIFNRTTDLMLKNIKEIFVFDGKSPKLKTKEQERRSKIKQEAEILLKKAKAVGNEEDIRKYSGRTARLTSSMIEESKELIQALGLPIIQAPAEGEAQASKIVENNDAYAVASEDFDCIIFGATRLIKNLSISGKRKKINSFTYITIKPELIKLSDVLNDNSIDRDELIVISMLAGTDFNIGGIPGIGAIKGLKLVKKYKKDFNTLFKEVEWDSYFKTPWQEIFNLIKNMPTTNNYKIEFRDPDFAKIKEILVTRHDFSEERVNNKIEKIKKSMKPAQSSLNKWF